MRARDIMTSPVVTVTTATAVKAAARQLAERGFTALPVIDPDDGDRLVGIVTEADLVRDRFPRDPRYRHPDEFADDRRPTPAKTVGEVMSTPVTAMAGGADVVDLVTAMLSSRVRSMPIVDGSTVIGIVTRRDLLIALARDDQAIATDVRHRLQMYGGLNRWTVSVTDGAVSISDTFDDATDRHVATVLAEAVPGVTAVDVTSERSGS
ncbi:MAG: CBS domain-containing protein [Sciscionella sp.]|nr:CBS domain-containing protein [Sciscionella sp.]